eukprot:g47198.t1
MPWLNEEAYDVPRTPMSAPEARKQSDRKRIILLSFWFITMPFLKSKSNHNRTTRTARNKKRLGAQESGGVTTLEKQRRQGESRQE